MLEERKKINKIKLSPRISAIMKVEKEIMIQTIKNTQRNNLPTFIRNNLFAFIVFLLYLILYLSIRNEYKELKQAYHKSMLVSIYELRG